MYIKIIFEINGFTQIILSLNDLLLTYANLSLKVLNREINILQI